MTFFGIRDRADRVRGIPLEAVLRLTGAEQDRHDKAKWNTAQEVLSVNGTKFMNWNRGIGGGGAIDLAIHLNNMDFKTALQWLEHHFPNARPRGQPQSRPRPGLKLPPKNPLKLERVRRYLIHDRGLPPALIQILIEASSLYADNNGNAVFLLLGKDNTPVGAELRGTTPRPWRTMATGSRKDHGYFSIPVQNHTNIILCESAIDAISCLALHPRSLCISTSGARPNPRWLNSVINQGLPVYCGFDSDQTGDDLAQAMIALHSAVKRLRPALNDWNNVLREQS